MGGGPKKPAPYVTVPDGLAGQMLDGGLEVDAVGLNLVAWSESSRFALDGVLARSRVNALRGHTPRREAALVAAGFWRLEGDAVVLVDYLEFNRTRAEIESRRTDKAQAGALGGATTAASAVRTSDGRFTSRSVDAARILSTSRRSKPEHP